MQIFFVRQDVSRRQRRLKNPGASAPGFTGAWGRSATNKLRRVYTGALLATTTATHPMRSEVLTKALKCITIWIDYRR